MTAEKLKQRWNANEGLRAGLKQLTESDVFQAAVAYWKAKKEHEKLTVENNAAPAIVDRLLYAERGSLQFLAFLDEITQAPKPPLPHLEEFAHHNTADNPNSQPE